MVLAAADTGEILTLTLALMTTVCIFMARDDNAGLGVRNNSDRALVKFLFLEPAVIITVTNKQNVMFIRSMEWFSLRPTLERF